MNALAYCRTKGKLTPRAVIAQYSAADDLTGMGDDPDSDPDCPRNSSPPPYLPNPRNQFAEPIRRAEPAEPTVESVRRNQSAETEHVLEHFGLLRDTGRSGCSLR